MADAWGGAWGTSWATSWFGAQAPPVGRYLPRGGVALNEEQREYWRRMREGEAASVEPSPRIEAPPPPKAAKAKPKPSVEAPVIREALDGRVLESVRKTISKLEAHKLRELEDDDEDVLLLIA